MFAFADQKRGTLLVLPVTDRALFRHAFGSSCTRVVDGRGARPARRRDRVRARRGPLPLRALPRGHRRRRRAARVPARDERHGARRARRGRDLVTRDAPGIARFNHERELARLDHRRDRRPPPARRRRDPARPRDRLAGHAGRARVSTPRGSRPSSPPRPAARPPSRASTSIPRRSSRRPRTLEPEVRSELLEQLTGDVEMIPSGSGFASATSSSPVDDAARVEAFVKKRCAEEAAKQGAPPARRLQGRGPRLRRRVRHPEAPRPGGVPARCPSPPTVADERLVITMGAPGKLPGTSREGDASTATPPSARSRMRRRCCSPRTTSASAPRSGAGEFFRAAPSRSSATRVAAAVEAWNYVSAHLSEALRHRARHRRGRGLHARPDELRRRSGGRARGVRRGARRGASPATTRATGPRSRRSSAASRGRARRGARPRCGGRAVLRCGLGAAGDDRVDPGLDGRGREGQGQG